MSDQVALLPEYLTAHLQLALAALLVGAASSVPAGVWASRHPRIETAVLGAAGVFQTIPSLALLALMVVALTWLGGVFEPFGLEVRSIGFLPAVIALSLYSVLPMLRNTVTGLAGLDPAIVEAARAVGMTDRQRLWRVELPLALPVIVAGVRTATVWVVGTATLSTPVGATSLGNYIFSGLQTRNLDAVLIGCVAAALLALVLDAWIGAIERALAGRRGRRTALLLALLAALYAYTAASLAGPLFGASAVRPIAIGSKTFTEQYILSEILSEQIARQTGLPARAVQSLGSTVAFDALRDGELDVYVDYSGTIWATLMKRDTLPEDRARVLRDATAWLEREHGITVAAALGFENTYAIGMRAAHAAQLGVASIGELVRHAPSLEIAGDYEFFDRPEWTSLRDRYRLAFRERRSMDSALMYQAVREGQVDVISAFSTDGRIAAYDIALLHDDRGVIPPYDAIVLVGPAARERTPEIVAALRALDGRIDAARMQRMNLAVDSAGRSPREVALDFLEACARDCDAPD